MRLEAADLDVQRASRGGGRELDGAGAGPAFQRRAAMPLLAHHWSQYGLEGFGQRGAEDYGAAAKGPGPQTVSRPDFQSAARVDARSFAGW